jgi:hypothetical protein
MKGFEDFEIWGQTASAPNVYPIKVTWSPDGPASGEMQLDPNEPNMQLLGTVQSKQFDPGLRRQFGQILFNKLFTGDIATTWSASRGRVQGQAGKRLRLRLWLEAPELSVIPWELLHDGADFVGASDSFPLSRYLPAGEPAAFVTPGKIKVLIVVQAPQAAGVPAIDPHILTALRQVLDAAPNRFAPPAILENPSVAQMNTELLGDYQVLHYIGHGAPDRLLLAKDQEVEIKDGREFAALFTGRTGLQLVLLNVCSSGGTLSSGIFSGLGPVLAEKRIPAVIAMQYLQVAQDIASEFNQSFYQALGKLQPVDVAVNAARRTLLVNHPASRDWSTPVLYQTTRNANVLEFAADEADAAQRARATAEKTAAQERAVRESVVALSQLAKNLRRVADMAQLAASLRKYQSAIAAVPAPLSFASAPMWALAHQGWTSVETDAQRANFDTTASFTALRNHDGEVNLRLPVGDLGFAAAAFGRLLAALGTAIDQVTSLINLELQQATATAGATLARIGEN